MYQKRPAHSFNLESSGALQTCFLRRPHWLAGCLCEKDQSPLDSRRAFRHPSLPVPSGRIHASFFAPSCQGGCLSSQALRGLASSLPVPSSLSERDSFFPCNQAAAALRGPLKWISYIYRHWLCLEPQLQSAFPGSMPRASSFRSPLVARASSFACTRCLKTNIMQRQKVVNTTSIPMSWDSLSDRNV